MAKPEKNKERELTQEEREAREKAEEVRRSADRIARQIIDLTRNGLFVTLRFMDVALCQFDYLNAERLTDSPLQVGTVATTGQHMIYKPQYIIEQYMKDKQALSRDYLHMVLHCVFRHPFVSGNLNTEYWNLATDIAVEGIISELEVKQAATRNGEEITAEIRRIRGMVKQLTAEHIYQFLMADGASHKDIEKWKSLFHRDDHRVWWEIAKQIAEELKKRAEEEEEERADTHDDDESRNQDEEKDNAEESEESEDADQEETPDGNEDGVEGENSDEEENNEAEEEFEEDTSGSDEQESEEEAEEDEEEPEDQEEEYSEEDEEGREEDDSNELEFEDEYSSTPGETLEQENPDDMADPDSETHETGEDGSDDGSGGGGSGEDPEESEEEGSEGKNDGNTEGIEGQNDDSKGKSDKKPDSNMEGRADEGQRDDSPDDPFGDDSQHGNSNDVSGEGSQKQNGSQSGQHSAGTGGGGDGSQSAWEHSSGDSSQRGGDSDDSGRSRLEGSADLDGEEGESGDDEKREEAQASQGTAGSGEEEKAPSYMHNGDEQKELEEKWKEISERMLVDLETSSREWGDKSDAMVQGIKKINKDKYDYATFLRKFSTLREDIQINDDEFDYVYYTLGMERYGNIPLIEPLEYKEVRKIRDFVIAIDTSGSCAGDVVQKFLDKTYSIFMQQESFFRKINLHIIQCDAQIQDVAKITTKEEFQDYMRDLDFKGFGGTDFRPVFAYVDSMIEAGEFDELKGLIYFTDGNGTYPKRRPPYETAFIFVDDDEFEYQVPSWAMKLVLETSDITEEVLI